MNEAEIPDLASWAERAAMEASLIPSSIYWEDVEEWVHFENESKFSSQHSPKTTPSWPLASQTLKHKTKLTLNQKKKNGEHTMTEAEIPDLAKKHKT